MKKLVVICLIALLSLGLMGPGYASWSNQIDIRGLVNSGILTVGVIDVETTSSPPFLGEQDVLALAGMGISAADLGSIFCWGESFLFQYKGRSYFDSLAVSINSYPGCTPSCKLEIANGGTIPAAVENVRLQWRNSTGSPPEILSWEVTFPDGQKAVGSDLVSLQEKLKKTILDPEKAVLVKLNFACNPGTLGMPAMNYTGDFIVTYRQWNSSRLINPWW